LLVVPRHVIIHLMIRSFRDQRTERVFRREHVPTLDTTVARSALRKLLILDAVDSLQELRVPPGNRLEQLKDDRDGQFSIRVNRQWRICFRWVDGDALDVEFTDYH